MLRSERLDSGICSGCEEQCIVEYHHRIIKGKKHYYAICDNNDDIARINLTIDDVTHDVFDISKFAHKLPSMLNLQSEARTISANSMWLIGRFSLEGMARDIILTNKNPQEVQQEVAKHNLQPLFVTFRRYDDAVFISDIVHFNDNGSLQGDIKPIKAHMLNIGAKPDYMFIKRGDGWEVAFEGKTATIRHSKGMSYIYALIQRANKEISAIELHLLQEKPEDLEKKKASLMQEAVNTQDVMDEQALSTCKTQLADLKKNHDEAMQQGMTAKASSIKQQIRDLESFLRKNTNIKGKPRKVGNEVTKITNNITQAFSRSIKAIGKNHPELSAHLDAHIQRGAYLKYQPSKKIDWILQS